jgi:hypothetical protein
VRRNIQTSRPAIYRFRVTASNNSGLWNEAGDVLDFSDRAGVLPDELVSRTQSPSRSGACLWAAYQCRVGDCDHQFDMMLETRVGERTRIARELHDTLLQSFHGLLLRFQTASYLLPEQPADAKEKLDGAIQQAAKAITEGRNAVQGLRASTVERNDLARGDQDLGDELLATTERPASPAYAVAVEGETRDLHPIVRDEIYKIAAEALRNAFRHAHAARVEVEIHYDDEQFLLRVPRRRQGDRSEGARKPGSRGTLRPARHARTCCSDRRDAGGVE